VTTKYLRLPFRPDLLIQRQEHPMCSLTESIAQHLHLLVTTYYGECKFDANFGSPIWEADFENITSINVWRNKTAKELEDVIKLYEIRLTDPKVSINLFQEEFLDEAVSSKVMKRKVELKVTARVESTSEKFEFDTLFYFSPISFD
jgi:phage baseplate assembly protein W